MYSYAQNECTNIINENLDADSIYTDLTSSNKKYNVYPCFLCDNISLSVYQGNTAYCHACKVYMSIIDIYRYYFKLKYDEAVQNLFDAYFNIKLHKNTKINVVKSYRHWLNNIHYVRLLKYYLDYFQINNYNTDINETKSTVSKLLSLEWHLITKNQIIRCIKTSYTVVPYYELLYFVLVIKYYNTNNTINLFKISKLYTCEYSNDMFTKMLNDIGMHRRTFNRLIAGHNIRNKDKYILLLDNIIGNNTLMQFINNIDNKFLDEEIFYLLIKNKII